MRQIHGVGEFLEGHLVLAAGGQAPIVIGDSMPGHAARPRDEVIGMRSARRLGQDRHADILEEMPPMEAADVLRDLYKPDAQNIINQLDAETAAEVKMHLAHGGECAGGIMDTSCLEAAPGDTVASVMARIRRMTEETEVFTYIYVLDPGRRLLGAISLRELLVAPDDAVMESLMTADPVAVHPETGLEDVGGLFVKYAFRAIPVVDGAQKLVGAVRLKTIVSERAHLLKES